jgi:hypothetical protein
MEESISIEGPGGLRLDGRITAPDGVTGGLVLCHPHPNYGGDMDNPVVVQGALAARAAGAATLRFDFRGVGRSGGAHGHGIGEREDARSALWALERRLPPGAPLGLLGYSFGAWVAAGAVADGARVAGLCLIAPPLAIFDWTALREPGPGLVVVAGTRDPYCSALDLERWLARFPRAETVLVEGADHFFAGGLAPVAAAVARWVGRWARGPSAAIPRQVPGRGGAGGEHDPDALLHGEAG